MRILVLLYRVVPSAFPCRLSAAPKACSRLPHTRLQRTDHRRPMPDTVDEALVALGSDRKPSPPSPSPSPDANDSTGAFIRLQLGPALPNRPTVTYPAPIPNYPNRTNTLQETGTRGLSRACHTQDCHQRCTSFPRLTPWRIPDVNPPPTRSSFCFSDSHTSTRST